MAALRIAIDVLLLHDLKTALHITLSFITARCASDFYGYIEVYVLPKDWYVAICFQISIEGLELAINDAMEQQVKMNCNY